MTLESTALAQGNPAFQRAWSETRTFYQTTLKAEGIVGSGMMVLRADSVVGRDFYGMADIETSRAVDANTIFHWASITKTFTAIAIMQLRDRGLLTLDDPVVKYVPEVREIHNPFGDASQITIRRLMSHSAGLRASTWPWGGDKPWQPFEPTEW